MKRLLNLIIATTVFLIFPISGQCQKQTQKVVEETVKNGQFEIKNLYGRETYECWFSVSGCNIDKNDFDDYFMRNRQYQVEGVKTRKEFKYRREYFYVTGFSFHNNRDILSYLELCICSVNKDLGLKLPSFHDFSEANNFYNKYVKPYPKVTEWFKKEFSVKYSGYIQNNSDALKRFCEGSPYQNNELVKKLNMWSVLWNCNKKYDYVYYLEANNGYYFDQKGDFKYKGDLKNGKPNGQGNNMGWEGIYTDGKKNGWFTYTEIKEFYSGTETLEKDYEGRTLAWGKFTFKSTGKCVNDQWDGTVETVVTCTISPNADITRDYYSNGNKTGHEIVSNSLTDHLNVKRRIEREEEIERRQRLAKRREGGEVSSWVQEGKNNDDNQTIQYSEKHGTVKKVEFLEYMNANEVNPIFRVVFYDDNESWGWRDACIAHIKGNPDGWYYRKSNYFFVGPNTFPESKRYDSREEAIRALQKELYGE